MKTYPLGLVAAAIKARQETQKLRVDRQVDAPRPEVRQRRSAPMALHLPRDSEPSGSSAVPGDRLQRSPREQELLRQEAELVKATQLLAIKVSATVGEQASEKTQELAMLIAVLDETRTELGEIANARRLSVEPSAGPRANADTPEQMVDEEY